VSDLPLFRHPEHRSAIIGSARQDGPILSFVVVLAMGFRRHKPSSIHSPGCGRETGLYSSLHLSCLGASALFCTPSGRIWINGLFIPRPIGTRRYYAAAFPPIAQERRAIQSLTTKPKEFP
jgi:hypothetical protein